MLSKVPIPSTTLTDSGRLSPESSGSMIGQPPSALECVLEATPGAPPEDDDFDEAIGKVCGVQDPMAFIMNERIDTKSEIFMDGQFPNPSRDPGTMAEATVAVPELPPPNVHPPSKVILPTEMSDFLIPVTNLKNVTVLSHQYLKKLKGLQSLRVELSWV